MSGASQAGQPNLWGQSSSTAQSPFPQQSPGGLGSNRTGTFSETPFAPRRPSYSSEKSKANPRLLFLIAGLFVVLAAVLLGVVYALGASNGGNSSSNTANTVPQNTPGAPAPSTPTAAATATPDTSPTATGTVYPGQQYIDGAQMAEGVNKTDMTPNNPTTTFKTGTQMYVLFNLHPPGQGGAVCSYWYLGGKELTSFAFAVKSTQKASYTYAIYNNTGDAYVELYWASSKSCSDKVLAQHVDFTVTA